MKLGTYDKFAPPFSGMAVGRRLACSKQLFSQQGSDQFARVEAYCGGYID